MGLRTTWDASLPWKMCGVLIKMRRWKNGFLSSWGGRPSWRVHNQTGSGIPSRDVVTSFLCVFYQISFSYSRYGADRNTVALDGPFSVEADPTRLVLHRVLRKIRQVNIFTSSFYFSGCCHCIASFTETQLLVIRLQVDGSLRLPMPDSTCSITFSREVHNKMVFSTNFAELFLLKDALLFSMFLNEQLYCIACFPSCHNSSISPFMPFYATVLFYDVVFT